jgi:outer membrane protein OmpA-like peptidoglycan-associated protein
MKKRTCLVAALCVLSFGIMPRVAQGEGRAFVGMDLGVMKPVHPATKNAIATGGVIAPYGGYMFNDYIGISAQLHAWAGKTKDREDPGRFARAIGTDDNTTWVGGIGAGPIAAIPLGKRFSIWGTFQPGFYTALADEALTDSSFGFSTGAGLNIFVTDNFSLGPWGRYNRLYQRIHGTHDAKYVTFGIGLTYWLGRAEEAPPPPPPPAAPKAAAPTPPVTKKVVPRAVYFDFDKSNIRPDARATLDEAVRILKAEPGQIVIAEGHTDSKGTDQYNEALSLRRARAVRDYLIKGGIPANDIKVEGFGESKPVASNETDEGRQQNRRVELRLMGK